MAILKANPIDDAFLLGFSHASFAFGHESHILKNDFKNVKVPPGALVGLLQKGLLYSEAEAHINEDGTERNCTRPFSLLQAHQCDDAQGNQAFTFSKKAREAAVKAEKARKEGKKKLKQLKDAEGADDGDAP